MKIEHFALQVPDPEGAAEWYGQHLGFTVKKAIDGPCGTRFLADSAGDVMLELYRNPMFLVPDYGAMDPAMLHIAMLCDDLEGTIDALLKAGAVLLSGPSEQGDDLIATLRDPWGLAIQFVVRKQRMV